MKHTFGILPRLSAATAATTLALTTSGADNPSRSAAPSPWSFSGGLALKEAFDDNIMLQSVATGDNRQSLITTILPNCGVGYKPTEAFNASLSYAPEINFFHGAADQDFTLHRTGLALGGAVDNTAWDVSQSLIWIDGSDLGPSFFGPGGAPAAGGPAIRDRHAALVERGQLRLTQTLGHWFIRPVVSGYLHDFETQHKTTAGYQNYVDRNDLNGGLDVGYAAMEKMWVTAGYRYGVQNQAQLFAAVNPTFYDNTYHRLLLGVEGQPWSWLKAGVSAGPEFRYYDGIVAAGFDRNETYAFADATLTILPTKADSITLVAKRFEQPGFGGRSAYKDGTYEINWRHKLTDKLTVGLGVRGYNTDFLRPSTDRNDWIYTGSAVASYAFNKHLSAEASYSYDDAVSEVVDTSGREYVRNYAALGIKYVF